MQIKSASQDLLALLLACLDVAMRPSPANILHFFGAGEDEHKLRAQLASLQRSKLLEKRGRGPASRLALTESGRAAVWGGVNPAERWKRPWDGQWRLLLFDLPAGNKQLRLRLWRWLRSQRFGFLQLSVWITPDAMAETCMPLRHLKLPPDSMVVMEGRPLAPVSAQDMANAAWDFPLINRGYQKAMDLAAQGLRMAHEPRVSRAQLCRWLAAERQAWLEPMSSDPLLPEAILPAGYLGRQAWALRQSAFAELARKNEASIQQMM